MLSVHFSAPFLLLALFASFGHVLPAPTTNKPVPACFNDKVDLALKWPVTLSATGSVPVTACNGTILGHVDAAGFGALQTTRMGTLPNEVDVYMPDSSCFLPLAAEADENQEEAIGSAFSALSTRSLPQGTTLYIAALDGIKLPKDAGVHNGCVQTVNRQEDIKSQCEAILNVGSSAHAALFAGVAGETAIELKDCTPGVYTSGASFRTTMFAQEDSQDADYPDPTAASAAPESLVATAGDSVDASYSLEDASYSLSEAQEAGSVDSSSSGSIEYVDCDENGNPINLPSGSESSSGNIRYVYVDCDENGNPIVTSPTDSQSGSNTGSGTDSSTDDDITWVDCDENGNPIVDGSGSDEIIYVDCDANGNPILDGSGSDEIIYVDCDASGNPILDGSDEIIYVDCDKDGNPIIPQ